LFNIIFIFWRPGGPSLLALLLPFGTPKGAQTGRSVPGAVLPYFADLLFCFGAGQRQGYEGFSSFPVITTSRNDGKEPERSEARNSPAFRLSFAEGGAQIIKPRKIKTFDERVRFESLKNSRCFSPIKH
jgi:hypothetical protein